jgi:hypothetical protein
MVVKELQECPENTPETELVQGFRPTHLRADHVVFYLCVMLVKMREKLAATAIGSAEKACSIHYHIAWRTAACSDYCDWTHGGKI